MNPLLQFSRRFLYRHPGQLALALVGIAAGVAVVTGVALLRDVLVQSLDLAADAITGQDSLRIEHPAGSLSESIYVDLATRAGSPDLIPVLRARARHGNENLEILAIDPLAPRTGPMGLSGPATAPLMGTTDGVIMSQGTLDRLKVDTETPLRVRAAGRSASLQVVAVLADRPGLDQRLIMDLANAQELLDRQGELSWIEAPAEARDWLARNLPDELRLVSADQRRDSAARLTAGMRSNLTAMSLLAFAVGLFVVHAVLAFLLVQRRRQIGMLRAIGVTPGQLRAVLAGEALVLTGFGALLGLALGTVLADALLDLVRSPVAEVYGMVTAGTVRPSASLYLAIWLMAVVLGLASVTGILRSAMRIAPGELSRDSQLGGTLSDRQIILIATALAVIGSVTLFIGQDLPFALAGLFLWLCVAALLAPSAGMALLAGWQRLRHRHLTGRAVGMLRQSRTRLAPALAALSLALGLSAGMAMMVLGFRTAVDDWVERLLRADAYLTVSAGQIDDELVGAVQSWPEVISVSSARQRELPDGNRLVAFDLPAPAWAGFEWLAGNPDTARDAFLAGQGLLITEPLARRKQLDIGAILDFMTPQGEQQLPVVAVYRDYGSDRGVIAIDGSLYRQLFGDERRDSLGLYLGDPSAPLQERLDALPVDATLTTREQVRAQTLAIFDRTFRISWALALLVGLIALVALVSALLALGLERGRDYATLRALGLTRAGLLAWVITQTTALAAAAAILAIPISLGIHTTLSLVIQPRAFGWTVPLTVPLTPWLAMLPMALAAGALAGLYPAWAITRQDPAPLLRSR
ncbi:MAG: ABC transporter permease [Wenzhouxiangella sp.]|nr:MAG: ABC transporter permease [Wenzhouxiangella sp.]